MKENFTNGNKNELNNPPEWNYLEVSKEKLENIKLVSLNEYPRFSKMENLDKYEKEKIESSYKDLLRITDTMKRYMDKMDELEQKGIKVTGTQHTFDTLRFKDTLFGPGSAALVNFNRMQLSMALILDRINTLEKNTDKK